MLDILVQPRRDANAAKRFFKRLLKGLQYVSRVIVTDKLRSYGVAQCQLLPGVGHRQSRYLNNPAETCISRHDDESGKCNGSNRLNKPTTSSPPTHSSTVTLSPPTSTCSGYLSLDPVGRFQSLAPRDLRSIRMKIDTATPLCLMPTTGD